MRVDVSLINIIILGLSFMFVFGAFSTSSMAEESVLEGAFNETGSGYISLAIVYTSFSLCNWVAPIVVVWAGPRISMLSSSVIYTLFVASFLKPMIWSLYLGSVLVGLAAAILWTGQGNYLTLNSDSDTIGRNSGIFYGLFQASMFFGNIYQYFAFKGKVIIQGSTRTQVFLVLTSCGALGTLLMLLLRKPPLRDPESETLNMESQLLQEAPLTPIEAFKRSFSLMRSKWMMLLLLPFAYTGFGLTFFSGVYGTCLGHTHQFGTPAKSYIGLSGIFLGVGEVAGSLFASFTSRHGRKLGREGILMIGYIVLLVAYFLIFVMLPSNAPLHETDGVAYMTASVYVAMVCAFLLGWGDSCFQTQLMAILGHIYSDNDSPSAFALFKFMQSLTAAIAFFYSSALHLQWQLFILVTTATAGTLAFFFVELDSRAAEGPIRVYENIEVNEDD